MDASILPSYIYKFKHTKYLYFPACKRDLDIALLVDRSSIDKELFPIFKECLKEIIQNFTIGSDKGRFAAVTFERTARVLFTFDQLNTSAQISSAIHSIEGTGNFTNIADAFRTTRTQVLVPPGDRPYVTNVCILFAYGIPTGDSSETEEEAARLKECCKLIIVTIGKGKDLTYLTRLSRDKWFFSVENFKLLDSIKCNLTRKICEVPGKALLKINMKILNSWIQSMQFNQEEL